MSVFEKIAKTVKEHPWAIIIVCLIITAALGLGMFFLEGEVAYMSLLPEDFPSVKALDALHNNFGGISYEHVLVRADSVTDPVMVEFLIGLGDSVQSDDRFNDGQIQTVVGAEGEKVPFIQDYLSPFVANMQREMKALGYDVPLSSITDSQVKMFIGKGFQQLVEEDYLSNPLVEKEMVGRFISPDRKSALVIIKFGAELAEAEQVKLANDLDDLFDEELSDLPGVSINVAGDATLARDFDRHIKNKTILLFGVAIAVVIGTLFLAFRRFSDTVLPIGVMMIGLLWTFGFAGWIGIPYSLVSIAIMPILMGTALTFVVPFIARYYEEMEHHFRSVRSVGKALTTVGVALFLAAVTNIFGFLVFQFGILPPLREFGLTCAVGTIFVFVLSVALLPSIMVVRDRVYEKAPAEERAKRKTHFDGLSRHKKKGLFTRAIDRVLESFSALSIRHSTLVVIVFAILIFAGFSQINALTTDSDLRELVPRELPGMTADYEIEEEFGGRQQDVVMVEGDVLSPESLAAMMAFEDAVPDDAENMYEGKELYARDGIMGLPDALASANGGKLPTTREEAEQAISAAEENGGFIVGGLISADRKSALISLNARGADSPEAVEQKMRILRDNCDESLEREAGLKYRLGGITPLTEDMTEGILSTETWSSILSLGLCALILVIIFRSFPYGLITLSVALAGVSAEIGFLSLMSWPLDIVTSLVSALVIGIGINFGILFTHRYIQERELGERLPLESVKVTMMNLGRANIVAAMATASAFLIIMLSDIVPLRRFGGVTAFAIGWCLVASLTLLPALLCRLSGHLESVKDDGAASAEVETT
ncbi:MAG: MMPL family transporter [Actinobacteria bacterium]|nr:MMPL family transporter [Actinomycetota bacterium]MCG2817536.1 MMPL family transporter [Actinomycetes bacterium]MBU4219667.1 MMPL family transporter [Actinomycetota bacterium]MBU4359724.1 MMPL family transporter [Actinomycetota bacterium]MBU4390982.1 MMPL family transporter [Actinomycetota bacterium]